MKIGEKACQLLKYESFYRTFMILQLEKFKDNAINNENLL